VRAGRLLFHSIAVGLFILAAPGCAQVTPHLVVPQFSPDDPAFTATLEAVTGAPVTSGNRVAILLKWGRDLSRADRGHPERAADHHLRAVFLRGRTDRR
jgi:hypothetical protein